MNPVAANVSPLHLPEVGADSRRLQTVQGSRRAISEEILPGRDATPSIISPVRRSKKGTHDFDPQQITLVVGMDTVGDPQILTRPAIRF